MKKTLQIASALSLCFLLSSCFEHEHEKTNKLESRLNDMHQNLGYIIGEPVEFLTTNLVISEDGVITGKIASTDTRVKEKSVYLDAEVKLMKGSSSIGTYDVFLYLNNGEGGISEETYKNGITHISWRVRGWGYMYPATITNKENKAQ